MVNKIPRDKSLIYGKTYYILHPKRKKEINQPAEKTIYKGINRDYGGSKLKEPGQK